LLCIPWLEGNNPDKMDVWDGNVNGTELNVFSKSIPLFAIESMLGVLLDPP